MTEIISRVCIGNCNHSRKTLKTLHNDI